MDILILFCFDCLGSVYKFVEDCVVKMSLFNCICKNVVRRMNC